MVTNHRILIVPAEIKAREYYSRLYFAAKAVNRGYTVLFGRSSYLHKKLSKFPRGIIVENDVTPRGYPFIAHARSRGYAVVAWDEEALVTLTDEMYAEYRVAERSLERVSLFFTRGPGDTAAIAARYPSIASKLRPVGNPRLDILLPRIFQHDATTRRRPGRTILFNSRFAGVNPYWISTETARQNRLSKYDLLGRDTFVSRAFNRMFDHKLVAFDHCRNLVAALAAAFPEDAIIVRPHPSEGHGAWEEVARDFAHCTVRGDGSAIDWMLQADVLVHNSCTTAIEANLLGLPTVNYLPNFDDMCDNHLTNLIGPKCHDISSVISAVRHSALGGKEEIEARARQARQQYGEFFSGLNGIDASDMILDEIGAPAMEAEPWSWRLRTIAGHWKTEFKHSVKKNLLWLERPRAERLKARQGYLQQKFADTNEREIVCALSRVGFQQICVEPFAHQWFKLTQSPDVSRARPTDCAKVPS